MPYRGFTDSRGTFWEVWEVEPSHAERRSADPAAAASYRGPERRRRSDETPRVRISSEFVCGWLCFQSLYEKRRLAPVPDRWDDLPDGELRRLLDEAVPVGRPRRLIE